MSSLGGEYNLSKEQRRKLNHIVNIVTGGVLLKLKGKCADI